MVGRPVVLSNLGIFGGRDLEDLEDELMAHIVVALESIKPVLARTQITIMSVPTSSEIVHGRAEVCSSRDYVGDAVDAGSMGRLEVIFEAHGVIPFSHPRCQSVQ
jgi:hypothetical protein